MTGRQPTGWRGHTLRLMVRAAIPALAVAGGPARAEPVTPWGVARTILL